MPRMVLPRYWHPGVAYRLPANPRGGAIVVETIGREGMEEVSAMPRKTGRGRKSKKAMMPARKRAPRAPRVAKRMESRKTRGGVSPRPHAPAIRGVQRLVRRRGKRE